MGRELNLAIRCSVLSFLFLLSMIILFSNTLINAETFNLTSYFLTGYYSKGVKWASTPDAYNDNFTFGGYGVFSENTAYVTRGILWGGTDKEVYWSYLVDNSYNIAKTIMLDNNKMIIAGNAYEGSGNLYYPFVALIENNSVVWQTMIAQSYQEQYRRSAYLKNMHIDQYYIYIAGTEYIGALATPRIFIAKLYRDNGSLVWYKQYVLKQSGYTISDFNVIDFVLDTQGNFTLVGSRPGPGVSENPIVVKIDSSGTPLWAVLFGNLDFFPEGITIDDQNNLVVISSRKVMEIMPNGTLKRIYNFTDPDSLTIRLWDVKRINNTILFSGGVHYSSYNNFNLYLINYTNNHLDYKVSPYELKTPAWDDSYIFLEGKRIRVLSLTAVSNTGGWSDDAIIFIDDPSSWVTKQLSMNTMSYDTNNIVPLTVTTVVPTRVIESPNISLIPMNVTSQVLYSYGVSINVSYNNNTKQIVLSTQGHTLKIGGMEGSTLEIPLGYIQAKQQILVDGEPSDLYIGRQDRLVFVANNNPNVTITENTIDVLLPHTGKMSITGIQGYIERIIVDNTLVCAGIIDCESLINPTDNLITLTGQEFKIQIKNESSLYSIMINEEKRKLIHKVVELNQALNQQLNEMLNNKGIIGSTLAEKLASQQKENKEEYYNLIRNALASLGIESIITELKQEKIITTEIQMTQKDCMQLRDLLETIYGPALINYPSQQGRIYLLYYLYYR